MSLDIKDYIFSAVILALTASLAIVSAKLYFARSDLETCTLNKEKLLNEVRANKDVQEVKTEYVDKIVEKEIIVYKDKVKKIKEYVTDGNISKCDNAMLIFRANF